MNGGMRATRRELGRYKVEAQPIGTRDEMHENFEMGRCDGPADRGEGVLVMIDRDTSVQRMLSGVSDLAVNQ